MLKHAKPVFLKLAPNLSMGCCLQKRGVLNKLTCYIVGLIGGYIENSKT